jgi:colanic acid biosynthesis glycosyl transferase WcaI
MRILIMAQHYAPEEVSGAVLATELAEGLVQRGWQVSFLTAAPSYPLGRVFPGYQNRLFSSQQRNGVRVVRTWSSISPSKSFWARILNYGTFSISAFFAGLASGRPDAIFCYSPPLPLAAAAALLALVWDIPWVMRVEDLYPDAAISAGVLRNQTAIRFFQLLERWLYTRATHISLISGGFRENLRRKGVAETKLSVTPVWADPRAIQPLPKRPNPFRQKFELGDDFILLYSGNLGQTSALEDILDAAVLLRDDRGVRFVIVGEGIKRQAIKEFVTRHQLGNILLLPFQPREDFPQLLAAADLGLVTLNAASADYSLPYKTFGIMASARPVFSIAPESSELARLVREHEFGLNVPPGAPGEVVKAIAKIRAGEYDLEAMGRRGRSLVTEGGFSNENCIAQLDALMRKVRDE